MTVLTTVAFGLFPAVEGTRIDLASSLKSTPGAPTRRTSRLLAALVVLQVSVSVVLMVGAVLLFRSLENSTRIDPGLEPDGVALVSFNLGPLGYDPAAAGAFYRDLLDRVRALPGVERAALADFVPMGRGGSMRVLNVGPASSVTDQVSAAYNRVSGDYFATVGQPLILGREFDDRDGAMPVAIVNETLARRFWGTEDPIGQRIRIVSLTEEGDPGIERQVVGVARDARYASFVDEIGPFFFVPVSEGPGVRETLHVRTYRDAAGILPVISEVVREIDDRVTAESGRTMREAMALELVPARVAAATFGTAGLIALLLATGGLYGLVSYSLEQRFREIGIRVALGATRRKVFRLIVGGTVRLAVVGVLTGLLLAAGVTRFLSSLLVGLSPLDPLTFGGVGTLLVMITLAAGYFAARKGLRVDPMAVLKHE